MPDHAAWAVFCRVSDAVDLQTQGGASSGGRSTVGFIYSRAGTGARESAWYRLFAAYRTGLGC